MNKMEKEIETTNIKVRDNVNDEYYLPFEIRNGILVCPMCDHLMTQNKFCDGVKFGMNHTSIEICK